jgi:hypothetical protein
MVVVVRRIGGSLIAAVLAMAALAVVAVAPAFAAQQQGQWSPTCSPWSWAWYWSPRAEWWYWQYFRWCHEPGFGWFQQWGSWGWW